MTAAAANGLCIDDEAPIQAAMADEFLLEEFVVSYAEKLD
jgi:hypothetical protein